MLTFLRVLGLGESGVGARVSLIAARDGRRARGRSGRDVPVERFVAHPAGVDTLLGVLVARSGRGRWAAAATAVRVVSVVVLGAAGREGRGSGGGGGGGRVASGGESDGHCERVESWRWLQDRGESLRVGFMGGRSESGLWRGIDLSREGRGGGIGIAYSSGGLGHEPVGGRPWEEVDRMIMRRGSQREAGVRAGRMGWSVWRRVRERRRGLH